jgi:hypothetical protein
MAHTSRRNNRKKIAVGFYKDHGVTKPITKPASDLFPKKIQGSRRFKGVSPNKSGIIRRLKAIDPTNVHLARFPKPKTEYMFGAKVLRWGTISFDFDGRHTIDDVVIVPHEFWTASWSRIKPEVYIDDNVHKKYWETASFHEGVEKDVSENRGLEPEVEAHDVAETVEYKRFLTKHTEKEWDAYDKHATEVMRNEWIYQKQFGTPMLTPIIRPHHGGGKKQIPPENPPPESRKKRFAKAFAKQAAKQFAHDTWQSLEYGRL